MIPSALLSSGSLVILFSYWLKLRSILQSKSVRRIALYPICKSKPRLYIAPTFRQIDVIPVDIGRGTWNRRLVDSLLYHSIVPSMRLLNHVKSNPPLTALFFSQLSPSLGNDDTIAPGMFTLFHP